MMMDSKSGGYDKRERGRMGNTWWSRDRNDKTSLF
jgi:hypothetical protein